MPRRATSRDASVPKTRENHGDAKLLELQKWRLRHGAIVAFGAVKGRAVVRVELKAFRQKNVQLRRHVGESQREPELRRNAVRHRHFSDNAHFH